MGANPMSQGAATDLAMPALRPGITYRQLANEVERRLVRLSEMSKRHNSASIRWRSFAGPLAWLAAVLAALAGLSVVTHNQPATEALSIATAVIAATNAAVNPAETARRHRSAALAYQHLQFKVTDVAFFEVGSGDFVPEEAGTTVPSDQLKLIREDLRKFAEEDQAIDESSPPLGPNWRFPRRKVKTPPQDPASHEADALP